GWTLFVINTDLTTHILAHCNPKVKQIKANGSFRKIRQANKRQSIAFALQQKKRHGLNLCSRFNLFI
ncbi:MAG: hypothetical protein ACLUUP_01575, partial [Eubacterium sp.]